jgi:hypothetical protein
MDKFHMTEDFPEGNDVPIGRHMRPERSKPLIEIIDKETVIIKEQDILQPCCLGVPDALESVLHIPPHRRHIRTLVIHTIKEQPLSANLVHLLAHML